MSVAQSQAGPKVVVFAPALLASVTIERAPQGGDELHVHAAGQGYWVARMLGVLGARPVLCCTAAGEIGEVALSRVDERIELRVVPTPGTTGSYVDDRRNGERERIADIPATPIDRHAVDDLCAVTIAEAIDAGVAVLTGSNLHGSLNEVVFARLAANLTALGVKVVADLADSELDAVLTSPISIVKTSHEELLRGGYAENDEPAGLLEGAARLRERCGADVYITCADAGVLAVTAAGRARARSAQLDAAETRGAGDSFTAALAYALHDPSQDSLRLATAAAAANVMRHGLGSGERRLIDALCSTIDIEPLP